MSRLSLLHVVTVALALTCYPGTVYGQSQTRYAPPDITKSKSAPSGNTGQQLRSSHRANVDQGYAVRRPSSITLPQGQARVPYGQSSFGQPRQRAASIGSGTGRSPFAKPFSSISASPTVSPYLNLFREGLGESDDFNYQTLVRPQLQQQQLNQQLQRQNLELSRRLQAISAQGAFQNRAGAENLSPTGHRTVFGNHSHYYPSAAPRQPR